MFESAILIILSTITSISSCILYFKIIDQYDCYNQVKTVKQLCAKQSTLKLAVWVCCLIIQFLLMTHLFFVHKLNIKCVNVEKNKFNISFLILMWLIISVMIVIFYRFVIYTLLNNLSDIAIKYNQDNVQVDSILNEIQLIETEKENMLRMREQKIQMMEQKQTEEQEREIDEEKKQKTINDAFFENISNVSQKQIFDKIIEQIFVVEQQASSQLEILQKLTSSLEAIYLGSMYYEIYYNLLDLFHLFLSNVYIKSIEFQTNLYTSFTDSLKSLLIECQLVQECIVNCNDNDQNKILKIICDYYNSISYIYEYKYTSVNKYPTSCSKNNTYYCYIKTVLFSRNYIGVEVDVNGDSAIAGPIGDTQNSVLIYGNDTVQSAKYESHFDYNLDRRCQGRLVYKFENSDLREKMRTIKFTYGGYQYSTVEIFGISQLSQDKMIDFDQWSNTIDEMMDTDLMIVSQNDSMEIVDATLDTAILEIRAQNDSMELVDATLDATILAIRAQQYQEIV
eukprot:122959_1